MTKNAQGETGHEGCGTPGRDALVQLGARPADAARAAAGGSPA